MQAFIVFLMLVTVVAAQQPFWNENQIPCGFTCSRRSVFSVNIDGTFTNVACFSGGADPKVRCNGCCQQKALAAGLPITQAAGFPSTNNQDCVCCINNNFCGGK